MDDEIQKEVCARFHDNSSKSCYFFNIKISWIYFSLEQRLEWLIKKQNMSTFQSPVVIWKVIPFFLIETLLNHLIYILAEYRQEFEKKTPSPENCSEEDYNIFLINWMSSLWY